MTSRPPGQRFTYVALTIGGLLLGVVGAGLSAVRIDVLGVGLPWGLVLVLTALGVGARAGAWLVGRRRGAVAVALGWALPTFAFAALTAGGDVLLPDLPRAYAYLLGGALVASLAASVPLPAGARAEAESALVVRSVPPVPDDPDDAD